MRWANSSDHAQNAAVATTSAEASGESGGAIIETESAASSETRFEVVKPQLRFLIIT